jgi:hypothetical protein
VWNNDVAPVPRSLALSPLPLPGALSCSTHQQPPLGGSRTYPHWSHTPLRDASAARCPAAVTNSGESARIRERVDRWGGERVNEKGECWRGRDQKREGGRALMFVATRISNYWYLSTQIDLSQITGRRKVREVGGIERELSFAPPGSRTMVLGHTHQRRQLRR